MNVLRIDTGRLNIELAETPGFDSEDRTCEPLKNEHDIVRVSEWLVEEKRYIDNMLFVVGCNIGLRVSDLITLRYYHFIDEAGQWRQSFPMTEKKTGKVRKQIGINDAVKGAISLVLEHMDCKLDGYLFPARQESVQPHINRKTVERLMKEVAKELNLSEKVATHTLRKTFGYHIYNSSENKTEAIVLLQSIFGHSDSRITMRYIGITQEVVTETYRGLNLGMRDTTAGVRRVK